MRGRGTAALAALLLLTGPVFAQNSDPFMSVVPPAHSPSQLAPAPTVLSLPSASPTSQNLEPALSPPPADKGAIGWVIDRDTGCKIWHSVSAGAISLSWSGGCSAQRLAQGYGVLEVSENGKPSSRFEGEYRDGKRNGHGVLIYGNGNRFDGVWRDDNALGHGIYTWENGNSFDGEWRGLPSGHGVYTTATNVYDGQWVDGCFSEGSRRAALGKALANCP